MKKYLAIMGYYLSGVLVGIICSSVIAEARKIDMSKAGVSLWIFLAVGACIILLQLIPAIIVVLAIIANLRKKNE